MDESNGSETVRRRTPERLGAFSDAVIAVIITIMVLELKAPEQATFAALGALWPTASSYAVSYLFVRSSGSITCGWPRRRPTRSLPPSVGR